MELTKLVSEIPESILLEANNFEDAEIKSLSQDSREVQKGTVFFAIKGAITDGHLYLDEVSEKGAVAIFSEQQAPRHPRLPWIRVSDVRKALALSAHLFWGAPSETIRVIGITGTNGKTTTAYLAHAILETEGPAFLMGTVETIIGDRKSHSKLTTPDPVQIQQKMAEARDLGCQAGVMEVSSHAIAQSRTWMTRYPVAIFTNLTRDHLDYHGSLDEYFACKNRLFDRSYNPGIETAVLNQDDKYSRRTVLPEDVHRITFGLSQEADLFPRHVDMSVEGTELELSFRGRKLKLTSSLIGQHNVYNILAAVAAASELGLSDDGIRKGIANLKRVPGRFERVEIDRPYTVIVDFAHTPDALENVLRLARSVARHRLICVFGCGGDRDRVKRPMMGKISAEMADQVIVTSDNPRTEVPEQIIKEIVAGIPEGTNFQAVTDRREAILLALEEAQEGDLILLAGKGHETYQEIQGRRVPFDERKVIQELT